MAAGAASDGIPGEAASLQVCLPIGGVLAVRNAVIPYAVGVDIACRVRVTVLDIPLEEFDRHRPAFAEAIEAETRFGAGAVFAAGERQHEVMEDQDWQSTRKMAQLREKAALQLGTSGSGNHFVDFGSLTLERDVCEPGFTLAAGRYLALMSHSGSRGCGEHVANYYSELAVTLHPNMPESFSRLAWLDLNSDPGREYWTSMQLMGRFASANHELIHRHVLARLNASALASVENHHNFAWKEEVDGEELVIHRKGATPAHKGVLGVIPGSMATPGFIVRGKGCRASFNSCAHGAGRSMSRKTAFKTLNHADVKDFLARKGVILLSGSLDEAPMAYKDIYMVMAAQTDLVDVLARFEPKLVKMATEDNAKPAWLKKARKDKNMAQS